MSDHANPILDPPSPPNCPVGERQCVVIDQLLTLRQDVVLLSEQVRTDTLTELFNFRHFRLYRMCMAPRVQLELKQHNPGFIELPAPSRPLSAAVEIFGKSLITKDAQCVVVVTVVVVQPSVFVLWLDFHVVLVSVLFFLTQQSFHFLFNSCR